MKFAAVIEYSADKKAVKDNYPEHRKYLRSLLDDGRLAAAGPLADQAGALWVLEAETLEHVEALVRGDPFHSAGIFLRWRIHPLAYWSAKEAIGS